ncbi:unnamed protein product [Gadus morhua 'NCC']
MFSTRSLCVWIMLVMAAPGGGSARKQDDSFFTASVYRARCASRCLSLHITRISAFFRHSQGQSMLAQQYLQVDLPPPPAPVSPGDPAGDSPLQAID